MKNCVFFCPNAREGAIGPLGWMVGAAKSNLVRFMGPVAKGRNAPMHSAAERGKVGFCPCCVSATPVAVPGTYCLVPYDAPKHTGPRQSAEGGPWAPLL